MSDLVGNPEVRFSHDAAEMIVLSQIKWIFGDNELKILLISPLWYKLMVLIKISLLRPF